VDRLYFRHLSSPVLENPVFVQGLPGLGNVGKIAAYLLVKFSGAEKFAEMYSPYFPDYVTVDSKGICQLPRYEFYSAAMEKNDFVIMTGDTHPSYDDVLAHYEVCTEILDFIEKMGCSLIVTLGGIATTQDNAKIMVAATSPNLAKEFAQEDAMVHNKGKIVGATGLMLGLAKKRGLKGLSLLGKTTGLQADRGAGYSVFKFLTKVLGDEVKEGL
jgi:uncharacterized protein (TIGR00162 family)